MRNLDYSRLHHAKNLPRLLAIKQAIYELGISRTALYELIKDGALKRPVGTQIAIKGDYAYD